MIKFVLNLVRLQRSMSWIKAECTILYRSSACCCYSNLLIDYNIGHGFDDDSFDSEMVRKNQFELN